MELLLITENKLKISLSRDDLDDLGIACDDIDYNNTETRRVFWSILDEAKHATGFDAAISRIFIQIYPDNIGGCEMYVSRIGELDGKKHGENIKEELEYRGGESGSRGVSCAVSTNTRKKLECRYYYFNKLCELLSACRTLNLSGFDGSSTAYICYGDECDLYGCYLRLECDPNAHLYLCEYGTVCSGYSAELYIKEHYKEICRDTAVNVLAELC